MAKTLEQNINQAISDFASIKDKIVEKGVDVPAGTPTRDYAAKVDGVYEAGAQDVVDEVDPLIVAENEKLQARLNGDTGASGKIYDKVYQDGVEDGKKAEYDKFWETYQQNGNRYNWNSAFSGYGWTDSIYNPKYPLSTMKYTSQMFVNSNIKDTKVTFNASETTNFAAFDGANNMEVIRLLIFSESTTFNKNAFKNCISLTSITLDGVIASGNLDISWSPLNKASLTSVVNALSATTTGLTVTLRLNAVNAAFETSPGASDGSTSSEWLALAATKPNWTISLINS